MLVYSQPKIMSDEVSLVDAADDSDLEYKGSSDEPDEHEPDSSKV
jgi:hypothetical protein